VHHWRPALSVNDTIGDLGGSKEGTRFFRGCDGGNQCLFTLSLIGWYELDSAVAPPVVIPVHDCYHRQAGLKRGGARPPVCAF
jgi:hypothetical protein